MCYEIHGFNIDLNGAFLILDDESGFRRNIISTNFAIKKKILFKMYLKAAGKLEKRLATFIGPKTLARISIKK